MTTEEIPNIHWADHAAEDLIKVHPEKTTFVCASGISPSGFVHIGNFREVITVDFVVRALKSRGKKVRFIYSWDDFDALRKVPANLPQPELINANLRKPLSVVPDPFGEDASYAAHFERMFEQSLVQTEIEPEFIRQNVPYQKAYYAQGIRDAVKNEKAIVEILNRFRSEPLPADWTCLSIFCKGCGRDTTKLLEWKDPGVVKYSCKACKKDYEVSIDEPNAGVKLLWRVDWPMRWAKEGVDFEPGGKDHSSQGGSYEPGAEIIRAVWKREPPRYVQYDFVLAKGRGAKLSSSSGNLITLDEALEIYEPSVLRWIFASRKPNIDFSIAFDLDVIRAYDDFDRTARIALGLEDADEKKHLYEKRIYELSITQDYPASKAALKSGALSQFAFRHLCNILQIHQGNIERAKEYFRSEIKNADDEKRYYARAQRAWKWISEFAPDDFKFEVRADTTPPSPTQYPQAVTSLVKLLNEPATSGLSEDDLASKIYEIMKGNGLDAKSFFPEIYSLLISKPKGPKLASFLLTLGTERAAKILQRAL